MHGNSITNVKCPVYHTMTRNYRAPEVIFAQNYTTQADMWSFACTIGELYLGEVLIYGETNTDQLAAIMEVLGLPPVYFVETSDQKQIYFDAINYKTKNGFQRVPYRKSVKQILKTNNKDFLDFMTKILLWNGEKRLTAVQAMKHPWLATYAEKRFQNLYNSLIKG